MGNWFSGRGCEKRIIFTGLDAAGKTTILYRMKLGEIVTTIPTIGFNVETIHVSGLEITCWDVGGRDKMRPLIRHYFKNTVGVVCVIDSCDRERLDHAVDELTSFILVEDEMRDVVVMLLANKQDKEKALSAQEIEDTLKEKFAGLHHSSQTIFVRPCSAVEGESLHEAFDFFATQLRLKEAGNAKRGLIPLKEIEAEIQEKKENQQGKQDKTKMAVFQTLSVNLVVALLVISLAPSDAARLPSIVCNSLRNLFVTSGCVDRETAFCRFLNVRLTSVVLGEPACDDFPCQGYVGDVGKCVRPRNCQTTYSDGICNNGDVCCLALRPTNAPVTVGRGSGGGGSSGGSSSSNESR